MDLRGVPFRTGASGISSQGVVREREAMIRLHPEESVREALAGGYRRVEHRAATFAVAKRQVGVHRVETEAERCERRQERHLIELGESQTEQEMLDRQSIGKQARAA